MLDKPAEDELILQIAGRNKYAGRAAEYRGFKALQLTRSADADELL